MQKGTKHSDETIQHFRDTRKGKPKSEEHKLSLRRSALLHWKKIRIAQEIAEQR